MDFISNIFTNTNSYQRKKEKNLHNTNVDECIENFGVFIQNFKIYFSDNLNNNFDYIALEGYVGLYIERIDYIIYNPLFVLSDSNNKNRFLVLFSYQINEQIYLIFGCIIYINELDENFTVQNVNILDDVLCTVNKINDFPTLNNVFFTNQSIIFVFKYDISVFYNLEVVVVGYNDSFISSTNFNGLENNPVASLSIKHNFYLLDDRFIVFKHYDDSIYYIIDMFSLFTDKYGMTSFTTYKFNNLYDFFSYMDFNKEKINKVYHKHYCDINYPHLECSKCKKRLETVLYSFNNSGNNIINNNGNNNGNNMISKNVCYDCKIYFDRNEWRCCNFIQMYDKISVCCNELQYSYRCSNRNHSEYCHNIKQIGNENKYPFNNIIIVNVNKVEL